MRVSIVTNAYNQAQFLRRAIVSVLSQEGVDLDYIVVDPGSTDSTSDVLREFQDRITIIRESDGGPAEGLNKAFARATGEVFGYLNADDLYLPGALASACRVLAARPDTAVVYADGYLADADGRVIRRVHSTGFGPRRFVYGGALVLQQSTFYRASAFRDVGGFNVGNRTSWDAEILLDFARSGHRLTKANGYWSVFTLQPESITVSQRYAVQSAENHRRFFRTVMGRDRRWTDRPLRFLVANAARAFAPVATVKRILDAISPSRLRFD